MSLLSRFSLFSLLICLSSLVLAAPPTPFHAQYDAKFQGFRAKAEMSLKQMNDGLFELNSKVKLKLLGKSISSIDEWSHFTWENDTPVSQTYSFNQKGIGKRNHSIRYDWENSTARTLVDGNVETLTLERNTLDELSLYTEIKLQLAKRVDEIYVDLINESEVKKYHFRVLGEELIQTPLGQFNAIKIERIRDEGSKRNTQLWLASDWEFILLKLSQNDDGKKFEINLRQATLGNSIVTALP